MQGKGRLSRWSALAATGLCLAAAAPADARPGALDPSFGGDGRVDLAASGTFVARAVAIDAEDRIVVGGYSCAPDPATGDGTCLTSGDSNFRLARLTPDGGLDPEFGVNGFVETAVGEGRSQALDLIVRGDGVFVGGVARSGGRDVFALARYTEAGELDQGFGAGGTALAPVGSAFASLADIGRGPDGTVLAAGQAVDATGVPRMAVARFTAAGTLDGAFGTGGVTLGDTGTFAYGLGLSTRADGSALVAGLAGATADPSSYRFAEMRVAPDGVPDTSFDGDGIAAQRVGSSFSFANAVMAAPGGWVLAGAATVADGRQAMAATRLRHDGRLDRRYGHRGSRILPLGGGGAVANDVLRDHGGRALLVGQAARASGAYDFATLRLKGNGTLDRSFGDAGMAFVRWSGYPIARATAGAWQRPGALVTVGIGCAGGTRINCAGGTARLLIARQRAER